MNVLVLIANLISCSLDGIIVTSYYNSVLVKNDKICRIAIIAVYALICAFITTLAEHSALIPIIIFIMVFLYSFTYRGKPLTKMLSAIWVFGVMIVSEILSGVLLMTMHTENLNTIQNDFTLYLQGVILSKLLIYFILKIIRLLKTRSALLLNAKISVFFILITLTFIFCFYYLAMYAYNTESVIKDFSAIALSLMILLSFMSLFQLFDNIIQDSEEKIKMKYSEKVLRNETKYYSQIKDHQQEIRKLNHDMKNIMIGYVAAINTGNAGLFKESAEKYIEVLSNLQMVETGNDAMNALFNAKNEIAQKYKIEFSCQANFSELKINEIDMCILVGNLLDNAIEASLNVAESNKSILFSAYTDENKVCIHCSNSYDGENISFTTIKPDKLNHGLGMGQIKSIVDKYGGNVTYKQGDGKIVVNLVMVAE